jgi:hypothetical protein
MARSLKVNSPKAFAYLRSIFSSMARLLTVNSPEAFRNQSNETKERKQDELIEHEFKRQKARAACSLFAFESCMRVAL